jgi:membrane protein
MGLQRAKTKWTHETRKFVERPEAAATAESHEPDAEAWAPRVINRSIFRTLGREFLRNEIPLRSAGISYFLFFALIPIVTTLVSLVLMVPFLKIESDQVLTHFTRKILPEAISDVKAYFIAFAENAPVVSVVGFFVSMYLLAKIVFFFEESLNRFWRLEAKRSPLRVMIKSWLLCVLVILGIAAGVAIPDQGALNVVAGIIITWALFLGFNRIVPTWQGPHKSVPWTALLPGSLLCGSVWYFSKWGFTVYLRVFAKADNFSALLGVLPLFLLWLYFSTYMLLLSACLNCALLSAPPAKNVTT